MPTINLPTEIFELIGQYGDIVIEIRKYKRKITRNPVIKSIRYKCFVCGKSKTHRQYDHFDDCDGYIAGKCKKTCFDIDLYFENREYMDKIDKTNMINGVNRLRINRFTDKYGLNWDNRVKMNKINRKLRCIFENHRRIGKSGDWVYNERFYPYNYHNTRAYIGLINKIRFEGNGFKR